MSRTSRIVKIVDLLHMGIISPLLVAPAYAILTNTSPLATGVLMTKVLLGSGLIVSSIVAYFFKQQQDISTRGWHWVSGFMVWAGFGISCLFGWTGLFCFNVLRSPIVSDLIFSFNR